MGCWRAGTLRSRLGCGPECRVQCIVKGGAEAFRCILRPVLSLERHSGTSSYEPCGAGLGT